MSPEEHFEYIEYLLKCIIWQNSGGKGEKPQPPATDTQSVGRDIARRAMMHYAGRP